MTTPATLDDLLALLPDNSVGAIDAADMRTIVTALWDRITALQAQLNDVVVTSVPMVQAKNDEQDARLDALEAG